MPAAVDEGELVAPFPSSLHEPADTSASELARRIERGFARLYAELAGRDVDASEIRRAVAHHLDAHVAGEDSGLLPPRLAAELRGAHADGTTAVDDLARCLAQHLREGTADEDHVALQLMLRLLSWHAFDRLRCKDEHDCVEVGQEVQPIAPHHVWRLRSHVLIRTAVAVATAVATFVGTLHLSGWLLDALDVPLAPGEQRWARYAMSGLLGVTTSWVVLRMKSYLERHLFERGRPLVASVKGSYRDWLFTGASAGFAFPAAVLVTAIILADVYTNFTGGAAFFAASRDREMQLEAISAELDERLSPARDAFDGLSQKIAANAGTYARSVLTSEAGGTSYSETPGKGPLYDAKNVLLNEDPISRAKLAESSDPLRQALLAVLDASEVTRDRRTMAEELGALAADGEADALEVLDGIEAERRQLSPDASIEELQARVDAITGGAAGPGRFGELVGVHEQLTADLDAHRERYNGLLRQIAETAERVGGYTVAPGGIESLEIPAIHLDQTPIEVNELQFREATELVRSAWEGFSRPVAIFILVASALGAILFSYLDIITGMRGPLNLREVHARDRTAAARIHAHLERVRGSAVDVLERVLREGPFSRFLATRPIPKERLAAALDVARQELAREEAPSGVAQRLGAIFGRWSHTAEAREANDELTAWRRILSSPAGIDRAVESLVVGLVGYRPAAIVRPVLAGPYRPDRRQLVRDIDRALDEATLEAVAGAIDALRVKTGDPRELGEVRARAEQLRARLDTARDGSHRERVAELDHEIERRLSALPAHLERAHVADRTRAVERAAERILAELEALRPGPDATREALLASRNAARNAVDELSTVEEVYRGAAGSAWHRASAAAERLERQVQDALRAATTRDREARRAERARDGAVRDRVARWRREREEIAVDERPAHLLEMLYEARFLEAPALADRLTEVDRAEVYRAALALSARFEEHQRAIGEDLARLP